jgi:sugar lactone lactonase YvrE
MSASRSIRFVIGAAVGLLMLAAQPAAAKSGGDARTVLGLAPGNHPEGIAVGKRGVIYLGNRRDDGAHYVSEILAIQRDGSLKTLAELAQLERDGDPGDDGVLGLATDRRGDVYAALVTHEPDTHGVWRISRDGSRRTRLPGSERMTFPNALAFDDRGSLYVTDSFGGAVWRFPCPPYGTGAPWAEHELLAPAVDDPLGFPLPGANGIGYARPGRLYVANTEKGLIAQVPIRRDGSAGEPALVAAGLGLSTVDGVAVDPFGAIHAVIPGHAILGISPLVRVDPRSGAVTSEVDSSEWDAFDVPLSLTFGAARDRTTILVANGDLPGIPPDGHLPGVVGVERG